MKFDAANVALHGRHLIEASAGTGKTYSIANLFLRLLLENHPSQNCESPLAVDQILVVTFTNAATDELRGRIRRKIEDALACFRGGDSNDSFILTYKSTKLTDEVARNMACKRLYEALLLVDEAAIFTIHSFASRAIQSFLFETGALADVEIVIGQSGRQAQRLDDVIRHLALGEDQNLGKLLADNGINARQYMAALNGLVSRSNVIVKSGKTLEETLQALDLSREKLLADRKALVDTWDFIDTKAKKSYEPVRNALVAEIGNGMSSANVTSVINFCNDNLSGIDGKYSPGVALQRIYSSPDANAFNGIARQLYDIAANIYSYNENEELHADAIKVACRSALLDLMRSNPVNIDMAQLQPDEVVQLINRKLDDPACAQLLREVISHQYPVCMVDEFQDTDPDQFLMFDRLYTGNDNLALYAIGDPKQSIYAFRGADVFAYLDVKETTVSGNIHTLDTNFRSKQGVMDSVNALFREPSGGGETPVFVYNGIDYESVESCENPTVGNKQSKGIYRTGTVEPASLVFVGNENPESQTFNHLLPVYAEDCAERIVALLQGDQHASVENNGNTTALNPGDIAVLVREFKEAKAVRLALAKRGLIAVYLAQKDSVFERCLFAKDLLFVLRAIDDPSNKYQLKAAFATPLMRGFQPAITRLQALDQDDEFERTIQTFSAYRKTWEEKGVMPALYKLFEEQQLAAVFAAHPDCDRLMTDFRHLGELLQQQYLQTGSRERLMDWYATQLTDDSALEEDAKSLRLESDDNLVKIVTLHGCKGLEYPVVFIPFFFGFKDVDLAKTPPFYHQKTSQDDPAAWHAVLDFQKNQDAVAETMCRERMAEDMRLLYVGITRAIYQCYIGISSSCHGNASNSVFPKTCWAHLLGMADASPDWQTLRAALQARMGDAPCEFSETRSSITRFNTATKNVLPLRDSSLSASFPKSAWQITSYSALAYQKDSRVTAGSRNDDDVAVSAKGSWDEDKQQLDDDYRWRNDIRYRLRGSSITGDCLHSIFENLADGNELAGTLEQELRTHGLTRPEWPVPANSTLDEQIIARRKAIAAWLQASLAMPLLDQVPCLQALFDAGSCLPECHFDFSLGTQNSALDISAINRVLLADCGASASIARKDNRQYLNGIMTGSIDLLFIHNNKVYVLDYKSNTLGKSPRFYDHDNMTQAMRDSRYDLQYLIYSVAAHRYMKQRLGNRYSFEAGNRDTDNTMNSYSFGGVFYLFLRGMGLPDYPDHGVWFHRPEKVQIETLDAALAGREIAHG